MGKVIPLNARQHGAALTVTEAVETFLDRDWSMHTRRNFASDLKRFREAFGRRRVDRLKADELQGYLDGLTTSRGAPERPVSAQTFNRHFGTLGTLFGWLERHAANVRTPLDHVDRRPRGAGPGSGRPPPTRHHRAPARIGTARAGRRASLSEGCGLRPGQASSTGSSGR